MIQLKKSNVLQRKTIKPNETIVKVGAVNTQAQSDVKLISYIAGILTFAGGTYLVFNKHPVVGAMLAVPAAIWIGLGAPAVENWS